MSAAIESLEALHTGFCDELEPDEAEWLGPLRSEAKAAFEEQGIPTRRLEAWKGTNLASLEKMQFARVAGFEPSPVVMTGSGTPELRFVDGRLDTANSQSENLPTGVRLLSLAEARRQAPHLLEGRLGQLADPKQNALVALQTAFLDDGAVLILDDGCQLEAPLRLRFDVTESGALGDSETPRPEGASAAFPRLLVVAGERSQATLYLEHASIRSGSDAAATSGGQSDPTPGLTALVAEFLLAPEAQVECVQVQKEGAARVHFTSMQARVERGARFDSHVLSLGLGLVRSELEVRLVGPGAETRMRGFFFGQGEGHIDHFTTVDHEAPHCSSDEEYRGVLGDASEGIFRGRVIVRPGAQKTDARQQNPNLLISDKATVDSKPQLEIYADDVRASHGSTTGQLDPDALFFLQARGIGATEARLLLTRSFAYSIVDGIRDEGLRAVVAEQVDATLASAQSIRQAGAKG